MTSRPDRGNAADGARHRCRCGHFPTTHMRVAPIPSEAGPGFRLEPTGPCSLCGESSCPRFSPES